MDEVKNRVSEIEQWNDNTKLCLNKFCRNKNIFSFSQQTKKHVPAKTASAFLESQGGGGDNACEFLEKFIKSKLLLLDNDLGIQCYQRSFTSNPSPQGALRPMFACFLIYRTKELVLNTVWRRKEVYLSGKRVYFNHDYQVEIMKKRKQYVPLKKVLCQAQGCTDTTGKEPHLPQVSSSHRARTKALKANSVFIYKKKKK